MTTDVDLADRLEEVLTKKVFTVPPVKIENFILACRAGKFHDFKSPLNFPKIECVQGLRDLGLVGIAHDVEGGMYDEDDHDTRPVTPPMTVKDLHAVVEGKAEHHGR